MNADATDFKIGIIVGLLLAFILSAFFWHFAESKCQTAHDASDCEWARSPFLPSPKVQP